MEDLSRFPAEKLNECRNGIGWQEVIAVLLGGLGGIVYCLKAKQPISKKAVVLALACILNFVGTRAPEEKSTASSQSTQQSMTSSHKPSDESKFSSSEQAPSLEQEAQDLLAQVEQEYNFSRFVDTWGMGTQGLFLPEEAWNSFSSDQQKVLIGYAESRGFKAIIVGKLLGPNNIALDKTVWGS